MKRWKFRIGVVLVFVAGLAIGGLGTGWWFAHGYHDFRGPRDRVEARIMTYLSWYLHLTDGQKSKMQPLVHDLSAKLEALRARTEPEIRGILEDGLRQSKPMLTAEQYERMEKRYQEMRRKWERRHDE
jgi:hypothetical protein